MIEFASLHEAPEIDVLTYLNDLPCIDMKNVMQACTHGTVIILFVSVFISQIHSVVSESAITTTNPTETYISNITIRMESEIMFTTYM